MKKVAIAVVTSVVSMCVYASDLDSSYTFTYEKTEEGYNYQLKTDRGCVVRSEAKLTSILGEFKPTREQLISVMYQQSELIDRLERATVEAQDTATKALAVGRDLVLLARQQEIGLKLQRYAINFLTVLNVGLVGYYWYQQRYGTQQNCSLQ
jgi:hypothetical protein